MPIATGVMLLTNVGLAIFNNWRGANNSKELQQKQREFQKAAQERNHERMKQLLREGQELNRKIEEELHQNRLENIERDFDSLINRIFAADDINTWPLKVLPMVMKNESLGSAFAHQEESVALHCILTPSNNSDFNKFVFPQLEREVEAFCNSNLTSLSSHPVIFYGGAWKSGTAPKGHEIDQLVADLPNLPMLLITPFFKPNKGGLAFHITTWGICERQFMEIVPTTQFDYDYTEDLEFTDDVVFNSVEQFSSYLESLIGYFADVYFWSAYNQVPITPLMIRSNIINTDGQIPLLKENEARYISLINNFAPCHFDVNNMTQSLLSGAKPLFDKERWNQILYKSVLKYYNEHSGNSFDVLPEKVQEGVFNNSDIDYLGGCLTVSDSYDLNRWITNLIDSICQQNHHDEPSSPRKEVDAKDICTVLLSEDIDFLNEMAETGNSYALFRLGEIFDFSIGVDLDEQKAESFYSESLKKGNCLALCRESLVSGKNASNLPLKTLSDLFKLEIPQAIIYSVALSYYKIANLLDEDEWLDTLDRVEDSDHPYAYSLGAEIIYNVYKTQYIEKVIELLSRASELGYTKASLKLATLYKENNYGAKPASEYIKYSKRAADKGSSEGILNLAICHITGYGVERSKQAAKKLLTIAAEMGNEDAIELLKHC